MIYLWSGGIPGLVEELTPQSLSIYEYWNKEKFADPNKWGLVIHEPCEKMGKWWQYSEFSVGSNIIVCGPCSSSLDVAWQLLKKDCLNKWDSVLAIRQWSGRGQLKRPWHSPIGNIYAALNCFPLDKFPNVSLPVIMGFCVVKAFKELGINLFLKWPNDLILNKKKVGGVLIEEKNQDILTGIGLNLNVFPSISQERDFKVLLPETLGMSGKSLGPITWWLRLVQKIVLCYDELCLAKENKNEFVGDVEQIMEFVDKKVEVQSFANMPYVAEVKGLAPDMGLRIQRNGKEEVLYNGSILPLEI